MPWRIGEYANGGNGKGRCGEDVGTPSKAGQGAGESRTTDESQASGKAQGGYRRENIRGRRCQPEANGSRAGGEP